MKWEGNRESDNVEDRRSSGGGGGFGGGRSIGIGTVVLALIGWGVFGINPLTTIGVLSGADAPQVQQAPAQRPPGDDRQAAFVSTVLASTEDVWGQIFQQGGAQYRQPKLVLFRGATPTACGTGWRAATTAITWRLPTTNRCSTWAAPSPTAKCWTSAPRGACCWARAACASSRLIWYGGCSITNSNWPFFTVAPST